MPKHIEDIVVTERKRSIRDIPIPEGRRRAEKNEAPSHSNVNNSFKNLPYNDSNLVSKEGGYVGGRIRSRRRWGLIGAGLLILTFVILSLFNGATLAYVPVSQTISFDNDLYKAQKTGEGGLLYSVIKLSKDKGLEVSASGEEKVERKASGTIVIYNTGTQEQRLRASTRFETPDGKIFRVSDAVTIPGKRIVGGTDQPGSLEVVVYAEQPGEEYNIGLSDFTLPGLKGTSSFATVYARSKTEMSGGFVGQEKTVNKEDQARTQTQLEAALREELIIEAKAQVPNGFILLPSLSLTTFEPLPQTSSAKVDSVTVNIRANLFGVMFKRSEISNYLALEKITSASGSPRKDNGDVGEPIDIVGLELLDFAFADNSSLDPLSSNEINFTVNGGAVAVWHVDEVALKADLAGRHKRDIPSILNNYPSVLSATATIRPFWKSSFPNDSADIFLKKLLVK